MPMPVNLSQHNAVAGNCQNQSDKKNVSQLTSKVVRVKNAAKPLQISGARPLKRVSEDQRNEHITKPLIGQIIAGAKTREYCQSKRDDICGKEKPGTSLNEAYSPDLSSCIISTNVTTDQYLIRFRASLSRVHRSPTCSTVLT
ncbi:MULTISPECIES: hypothetical protein [Photorhabdus]|uniref:Uncharacterized protein n=2 Tax=Photorhabdus asymbiotica TaxID=291112 RepID=C7BK62_PHOAA|nr:hypothetical protein [Photorhabdus asymbiotica]RKS65813.1 hypothetical protein BDD30_0082 [Photorhabdus asymbiotica]CAQ84302.1 hypothetical protein PAU_02210 [Photorhabdus asymbiotica]